MTDFQCANNQLFIKILPFDVIYMYTVYIRVRSYYISQYDSKIILQKNISDSSSIIRSEFHITDWRCGMCGNRQMLQHPEGRPGQLISNSLKLIYISV